MMMTIGLHCMTTVMLLTLYTGYVLGQNSTTANSTEESFNNSSGTADLNTVASSHVGSITVGSIIGSITVDSDTNGSEGQHSTAAVGLKTHLSPTTQSLSADEDDTNDLLIGIAIGGGAVLGAVLVVCASILVVLRVSAMKKRRISTSPPECDTQPLEMKNEQSTEP